MKYRNRVDLDCELLVHYDFRQSDSYSYDGGFHVKSHVENDQVHELIDQIGFKYNNAPDHSGIFLGSSNVTGHFVDGFGSEGVDLNGGTYIKISNPEENLYHESNTFLISQQKKSIGPDILFSNYSDNKTDPKGFEIGLNSANKLYFEYMGPEGPSVHTLNNVPHKKNIYAVHVNRAESNVGLSWWNVVDQSFETNTFSVSPNYIRKSNNWYIGSGIYSGDAGINEQAEPYTYGGYMDRFLCFDGIVRYAELNLLCRSLYGIVDYVDPTSGYYEGHVTGYESTVSNVVSGVTGYETVQTGYNVYTREFDKITGYNLYGTPGEGQDLYIPLDDEINDELDLYYKNVTGFYSSLSSEARANALNPPTYGVTGFETGTRVDTYTWSEPLYYESGVSGFLYNVFENTPVTGGATYYRTQDGYHTFSGDSCHLMSDGKGGYGPRSYTYLGARNLDPTKDFIETQRGINFLSINNYADVGNVGKFDGRTSVVFSADFEIDPDKITLSINGVSQAKGNLKLLEGDNYKYSYSVESGNFAGWEPAVDEFQFGPLQLYYKDDDLSLIVDTPVIEVIETHDRQYLRIENVGGEADYTSAPFSEIDPSVDKVFFNGQKIYSGVSYIDNGGLFEPIGEIKDMSGVFHTEGEWVYDEDAPSVENTTGFYDLHEADPFILDSYLSYLNGVKLDPKAFVQHDRQVDLLSQGNSFILENQMMEIYNNKAVDWFTQDIKQHAVLNGPDWMVYHAVDEAGDVINENWEAAAPGTPPAIRDAEEILNINYEDL
jgi:hypothetical protein